MFQNSRFNVHIKLIRRYLSGEVSDELFSFIFEQLYLDTSDFLDERIESELRKLYALSRDWGDPDPDFTTCSVSLREEAQSVLPILEKLYSSQIQ
jgi:hypothetical protein